MLVSVGVVGILSFEFSPETILHSLWTMMASSMVDGDLFCLYEGFLKYATIDVPVSRCKGVCLGGVPQELNVCP